MKHSQEEAHARANQSPHRIYSDAVDPTALPPLQWTHLKDIVVEAGLDSMGDQFTKQNLAEMVAAAQPQVRDGKMLAMEGFGTDVESVQGAVEELSYSGELGAVWATIRIFRTPAGYRLQAMSPDEYAIGLSGKGTPKTTENPEGGGVIRTYDSIEMTGVSIMHKSEKIR